MSETTEYAVYLDETNECLADGFASYAEAEEWAYRTIQGQVFYIEPELAEEMQ